MRATDWLLGLAGAFCGGYVFLFYRALSTRPGLPTTLDLVTSVAGARNMIGIGVATAAAGIVVGTVTLTGVGLVMTELVDLLSGGNLVVMLLLTTVICLILGMGLPSPANYIVVAPLMAPVVVELAAKNDLAVSLVALALLGVVVALQVRRLRAARG